MRQTGQGLPEYCRELFEALMPACFHVTQEDYASHYTVTISFPYLIVGICTGYVRDIYGIRAFTVAGAGWQFYFDVAFPNLSTL